MSVLKILFLRAHLKIFSGGDPSNPPPPPPCMESGSFAPPVYFPWAQQATAWGSMHPIFEMP